MMEQTGLSLSLYKTDKTIIVSFAFSIPQSVHFSRLSPSPEEEADGKKSNHTPDTEACVSFNLHTTSDSALCNTVSG